jgi:poly(A) polymerase Pap1
MKQLFRCEYCDKTGTAEQIAEHEKECMYNYHKRSCWTCKYAELCLLTVKCKADVEIPKDKYIENCTKYEWDEKDHSDINATAKSLFGGTGFGGLF